MAQALSAEEFQRMQVRPGRGSGLLPAAPRGARPAAAPPSSLCSPRQAQLLELRTENYRLSDELRKNGAGTGRGGRGPGRPRRGRAGPP